MAKVEKSSFSPDYEVLPGRTLLEVIRSRGFSQADIAMRTGHTAKMINEIIKGIAPITPETAIQFERVLGVPSQFWNNLERNYQNTNARIAEHKCLETKLIWLKNFPVREMIRLGWLNAFDDKVEQLQELLNYFGVASPEQWEKVWVARRIDYRQSQAHASKFGAIAAWLRRGEILAKDEKCEPYDKKVFHDILLSIRALTLETPETFVDKLSQLTAKAGVFFAFIKELSNAKLCGATYWVTPTKACIQQTIRYKSNDQVWFTFFHEAGHILYDGKRTITIDKESQKGIDTSETRANNFARNILIPPSTYRNFVYKQVFTKSSVTDFAQEIGVASGIVVGRLQYEGFVPWNSNLNKLKEHYSWEK